MKISLIILILFLTSCSTKIINFNGEYSNYTKGKISIYFNKDSTFVFRQKELGTYKECKGEWKLDSKKKMVLKCKNDDNLENGLSSKYIGETEIEIVIINLNKIKIGKKVLKKDRVFK